MLLPPLSLLCVGLGVEVVVDDEDVVVVVVVVVGPKVCVEDQPGSTVRRVPRPACGEQSKMEYILADSSLEADVEMTHV